MKTKNIGPDWGGQNWRPGKEAGTWFRHSPEYGPIVHYGEYLVILRERRNLSREEWFALRKQSKLESTRLLAAALKEKKAAELPRERTEKQCIIDRLIKDTVRLTNSQDWSISHVTSAIYRTAEGVQLAPYEKTGDDAYGPYVQDIKWTLFYKGIHVWTWENGGWECAGISQENLATLGIPVKNISDKCLEYHLASKHANDPVKAQVSSTLVEPKDWSKGSPCGYPLYITLVGNVHDYHYKVDSDSSEPVFERTSGNDPQDSHVGWGWGDE